MRFDGTIKSWNDERGFGFIAPLRGGQDIFVHAKAIAPGAGRPQVGRHVSFEVETGTDGRKRARLVQFADARKPAARSGHMRSAHRISGTGAAAYAPAVLFVPLYVAASFVWTVPLWVAAVYGLASIVCLLAYAIDKSAAQARAWRISESTLLLLGLLGGWPGAIIAQQLLRHKSSKASFRAAFWLTVALNVAAFILLAASGNLGQISSPGSDSFS